MPRKTTQLHATISAALKAARDGREADFLALTAQLPGSNERHDLKTAWLLAERAYQRRDFPLALQLYREIDEDPRSPGLPIWMRYLSSHRQSVCCLMTTDYEQAAKALSQAEERLGLSSDLRTHRADLEALHAYFLEYQNNFEAARTRFEAAHRQALADRYWLRAITTAADLGRVLAILGHPADAQRWLEEARRLTDRTPDHFVMRTIELRLAQVDPMLGKEADAFERYEMIIRDAADGRTPEVLIDALGQRASIHQRRANYEAAHADRGRALDLCHRHGLHHVALYLHRDQAFLFLEMADVIRAREQFSLSLGLLMAQRPPQLRSLLRLADDVLTEREILPPRTLGSAAREDLRRAVERLRPLTAPHVYNIASTKREVLTLARRVIHILSAAHKPDIALQTCVVRMGTRRVLHHDGTHSQINPTELDLLQVLLKAPPEGVSTDALEDELGIRYGAVMGRIKRLRAALGKSFTATRVRREMRYAVRQRTN